MSESTLPPFPPPQHFGELDFSPVFGSGPFSTTRTPQPYDLVQDLPGYVHNRKGWQTTRARGGAAHYSSEIGYTLQNTIPPIDRAFYFTVDDNESALWGFYGNEGNPNWSFVVKSRSDRSVLTMFDQSSNVYFETLVKGGNSSFWGYVGNSAHNFKGIASGSESKLMVYGNSTYNALEQNGSDSVWKAKGGLGDVNANTADLEGETAVFRKLKLFQGFSGCGIPKFEERIVLATDFIENYSPDGHEAGGHHCIHESIHLIVHANGHTVGHEAHTFHLTHDRLHVPIHAVSHLADHTSGHVTGHESHIVHIGSDHHITVHDAVHRAHDRIHQNVHENVHERGHVTGHESHIVHIGSDHHTKVHNVVHQAVHQVVGNLDITADCSGDTLVVELTGLPT
jgi:hypothetical protein